MKITYNKTAFTDRELQTYKFRRSEVTTELYKQRLALDGHVNAFEDDVRKNGLLISKDVYFIENKYPYETLYKHYLLVSFETDPTDPKLLVQKLIDNGTNPVLVFENDKKDQSVKTIKHYHVFY